jgi:catechol 2,3-dioxygenase-like lactoylglutathione lyase family enzyme
MGFDHVEIHCTDFKASYDFYSSSLSCLGFKLLITDSEKGILGFGTQGFVEFHITTGKLQVPPLHIAFTAKSIKQVQDFYEAGLANGGTDNGSPGYRVAYYPQYYAAFLFDPDLHNIEAVYREYL